MANDCLVTKLKGSVDNPNLKRLGYMKFVVKPNTTGRNGIVFKSGVTPVWELEGPANTLYFSNSSYTSNDGQTHNGGGDVYIVNSSDEPGILWVSNKYDIIQLYYYGHQDNIYTDDSEDGNYVLQNLNYINISRANKLKVEYITNTEITKIEKFNIGGVGSLSHFSTLENLTNLYLDNVGLKGDISSLTNLINLTNLYIANTLGLAPFYGSVTGKAESFLKGLLDNGKTGSIRIDFHSTLVTVKGVRTSAGTSNQYHNATFSGNTITVNDKNGNLYIQYNGTNWLDANGDIYTP